ncbi:hypothetical protein ACS126_03290 [Sphingobacterium lactis]|uniref:hypothetical protein n=1 Tax=Sphingobacterium TaxID=28453 RepID=UPI0021A5BBE1|nr:hypothetical protein [Sphingobacterium hotanense]MCT1525822.1 hypothetical protein [Sphingobacterium hotanense]
MENRHNTFLIIAGTLYEIDQVKRTLSPFNGDGGKIHENEMRRSGKFHFVGFEKETMALKPLPKGFYKLAAITIPRQAFDDIGFPKTEELAHFNNLSKQYKWGVTFLSQDLVNRIRGALPIVDVAGVRYDLDIEKQVLRTKSKSYPDLSMENMEYLAANGSVAFVYNREKRCAIDVNKIHEYIPQETFFVEMEDPASLDPVGMAKRLGLNEGAFILPEFKYQPLYHTSATPLDKLLASQSGNQLFHDEYNSKTSALSGAIHDDSYSSGATLKR